MGSNPTPRTKVTQDPSSQIFNTLWHIRSLRPITQRGVRNVLKILSRNTDLNDPEATERYIMGLDRKAKYKNNLLLAYKYFCEANKIEWQKPKKLAEEAYPVKIPTEERINVIISNATPKYATAFQLSKYGLRPDEISKVTLRDLDLERGELTVRTSKLGLERALQIKREVIDSIKETLSKWRIKDLNQRIFGNTEKLQARWVESRKKAYEKVRDPELLKIRLYDLRHWFATITYLKTRDIFYVKYALGHRNIQSTLVYMHIAKGLVNYSEDYSCRVAGTLEEAVKLVESGFEYVTEMNGVKIFRKRK